MKVAVVTTAMWNMTDIQSFDVESFRYWKVPSINATAIQSGRNRERNISNWPVLTSAIFQLADTESSRSKNTRFEKWPTPKIIASKDPERLTKYYYVYFLRLLSDKNLIDKNPSSKISSMGKFFSWNDLRSFYISECLRAFIKSFKNNFKSGKSLEDLLTWRLFP